LGKCPSPPKSINGYRGKPNKLPGITCDGLASRPGGVEILLAASSYRNRGISSGSYEPVSSKASRLQTYAMERFFSCIAVKAKPK